MTDERCPNNPAVPKRFCTCLECSKPASPVTTAADISPEAVAGDIVVLEGLRDEHDRRGNAASAQIIGETIALVCALRSALTDAQEIARRGDDIILRLEKTLDAARASLTARDKALIAARSHIDNLHGEIGRRTYQQEELGVTTAFDGLGDGQFNGDWASILAILDAAMEKGNG